MYTYRNKTYYFVACFGGLVVLFIVLPHTVKLILHLVLLDVGMLHFGARTKKIAKSLKVIRNYVDTWACYRLAVGLNVSYLALLQLLTYSASNIGAT